MKTKVTNPPSTDAIARFGINSVVPVFCLLPPPEFAPEEALDGGLEDGGAEDERVLLLLLFLPALFFSPRKHCCFEADEIEIPDFVDATRVEWGL